MSTEIYTAQRIRVLQSLNPSNRYFDMLVDYCVARATEQLRNDICALNDEADKLDYALNAVNKRLRDVQITCETRVGLETKQAAQITFSLPEKYTVLRTSDFSQQHPEKVLTAEQTERIKAYFCTIVEFAAAYNAQAAAINEKIDAKIEHYASKFVEQQNKFKTMYGGRPNSVTTRQKRAYSLFYDFTFGSIDYANSYEGAVEMIRYIVHEINKFVAATK